ncbi:MAG: hypothetical protein OXU79_01460 [Gemmatimonadota bacterium]|nr:hypothetical protein [Gemmatimonadota bacterium]
MPKADVPGTVSSVYIGFDTSHRFEQIHGPIMEHVISLLTGRSSFEAGLIWKSGTSQPNAALQLVKRMTIFVNSVSYWDIHQRSYGLAEETRGQVGLRTFCRGIDVELQASWTTMRGPFSNWTWMCIDLDLTFPVQ